VLDVKNSLNEAVKQITCPSCKTILQVKFQPQQEPIEAKTFYAPPKQPVSDSGATQLAGNSYGDTQLVIPTEKKVSKASLEFRGVNYPLEEGQNIIGRKGTTSKATVQIETSDRYMSRQHCKITVSTLPDGTKKAVLSNYLNKNQTTIDGQPIETGDSIRLTDGNTIMMGYTTLTFKLEKQ
jgi:hypothetical protein